MNFSLRNKFLVTTTALVLSINSLVFSNATLANNLSATAMGVPLVLQGEFGENTFGLTGKGQVVGVADNGLGTGVFEEIHPDLIDRIVGIKNYSDDGWDDPSGHGTHIAATIVGSGEKSDGHFKGIATGAELYFQATYDGNTGSLKLPEMYQLLQDAYENEVRIHSNSWGFDANSGQYDDAAHSLDKFVWEHRDMVVLKSAGNGATYVSSPGAAKNAITVGATESPRGIDEDSDNPKQVAAFSGFGTSDGRIKPDLVAPGTWIMSASRADESFYQYQSGTSMATALATGAAALVRQYLEEVKQLQPSAAMVKAALIHGARELPGEPRVKQGFGMIDVQATVMALEDEATGYRDNVKMKHGEKYSFEVKSDGQSPLAVTVVWSDYPQRARVANGLVNDLDLQMVDPDGRVFWGNNTIGGDKKNNVEVIRINNPQSGTYTITVKGAKIVQSPQPFSIIYGDVPHRGTIKNATSAPVLETEHKTLEIDPETKVKLVKDNKLQRDVAIGDLPTGTDAYYYPQNDYRILEQFEAMYDLAYTTLTKRLLAAKPKAYPDTKGHWAEQVITSMSNQKVIGGFGDGTFRPDQTVTRAQFASMLVRALKLVDEPGEAKTFRDVANGAWYQGAVGAAVKAGLVVGYTEHTFGPNDPITREQMTVMIARVVSGGHIPYSSEDRALDIYRDLDQISLWAQPSIAYMVDKGVISGRAANVFAPQGTATRAEAVAVIQRMLDLL
ncbi:S8 family serine peptidase [Peptococcaceae bacterium 1198_IL3148]